MLSVGAPVEVSAGERLRVDGHEGFMFMVVRGGGQRSGLCLTSCNAREGSKRISQNVIPEDLKILSD